MKIRDLKIGKNVDFLRARVVDKVEPRSVVTRFGKRLTVTRVMLEDDTGSIRLTLWGRNGERVSVGDVVEIRDGFVKEFRGEKQLTLGRSGNMRVVE